MVIPLFVLAEAAAHATTSRLIPQFARERGALLGVALPAALPMLAVLSLQVGSRCGSTWYIQAYAGGDLRYMAVNPTPGC